MFSRFFFILLGLNFVISTSHAALLNPIGSAPVRPDAPGTSKILSPQDFQNKVKEMGDQTQTQAQQKATQMLSKLMPDKPSTSSSTLPASPMSTQTSKPQNSDPFTMDNSPTPASSAVIPAPVNGGEAMSELDDDKQDEDKQAAQDTSTQGYTGFGTKSDSSTTSGSQSSGGWSIKY